MMDVKRSFQRGGDHSGDELANSFDAFVLRSRSDLFRALAAHFHHEVATEVLADAYAYAWVHWDTLAGIENPTGYIYRVAERLGMRAEVHNRRFSATEQLGEQLGEHNDQGARISGTCSAARGDPRWLEAYESDSSVIELLRVLPSRQRACVLLIHAYGWTYKDAARTLDLPITTVTNEATRGMMRLRNSGGEKPSSQKPKASLAETQKPQKPQTPQDSKQK
jgi:DNA-directed RNA polymerase specialized sigma24 family protein